MDALNDCLVMENLAQVSSLSEHREDTVSCKCDEIKDGFVKFSAKFGGQRTLSDMDHCRIVLRALAHFHAYSTIIQRDSEEPLLDLWPFAVEASNFREVWAARMRPVKEQVGGWRLGRPRVTPRCVAGVPVPHVEEVTTRKQNQCRGGGKS